MKFILNLVLAVVLTVSTYAQGVNFSYQGWSSTSGKNNLSLYIAREGFKLGSAFNDQNYPIWFTENQSIMINDGVVNYRITGVNLDSLQKYQGNLFLYVAINGTPHDTISIDPVPYSAHSLRSQNSVESEHSTTSNWSNRSRMADTATYALNANRSVNADTATYSKRAGISDSSNHSAHAVNSDSSHHSLVSDSAIVASSAYQVLPGGVNLQAISAQGASDGSILTTNGTTLSWASSTQIQGKTQLTLVPLQTIANDVRTLIYRVAQDITTPLPAAGEGRIITIVNSSTANMVWVQSGIWNVWGGDVFISARSSATFLYHNGQWVVIYQ